MTTLWEVSKEHKKSMQIIIDSWTNVTKNQLCYRKWKLFLLIFVNTSCAFTVSAFKQLEKVGN